MTTEQQTLQGWYEDPEQPGQYRFYDGSSWGEIRLAQAEVPTHLIRGIVAGSSTHAAPSPRQVQRRQAVSEGLRGLVGAWGLLALAASLVIVGAAHGGWVVAGVLGSLFPGVVAFVIGMRMVLHGASGSMKLLGGVTAIAGIPGGVASFASALIVNLAMIALSDGWSFLSSDALDFFGMFSIRDADGGVDGAHGVWLWAAGVWCVIVLAFLSWGT